MSCIGPTPVTWQDWVKSNLCLRIWIHVFLQMGVCLGLGSESAWPMVFMTGLGKRVRGLAPVEGPGLSGHSLSVLFISIFLEHSTKSCAEWVLNNC